MTFIASLDYRLLSAIAAARHELLTAVLIFITRLGDHGAVWLVLAAICLARRKTRPCGVAMLLALLLSLLVGNLTLKPLIARARPFETYPELVSLIAQGGFSFPSAHAMSSFAAGFACHLFMRKSGRHLIGIFCLLLASGIAFSRVYVGVHYPSDVLCGALIGIVLAIISTALTQRIFHQKISKSGETPNHEQ